MYSGVLQENHRHMEQACGWPGMEKLFQDLVMTLLDQKTGPFLSDLQGDCRDSGTFVTSFMTLGKTLMHPVPQFFYL